MRSLTLHTSTEKRAVTIPTAWNELTLGQLMAIEKERSSEADVLRLFSILAGVEIQLAENITDTDIEANIFEALQFLNEPPDWNKLTRPTHLIIEGRPEKIPTDVGAAMLGQKIMLMGTVSTPEKMLESIGSVIAIYMQPEVDKKRNAGKLKYDSERVKIIAEDLKNANGLECYATALFFFARSKELLQRLTSESPAFQKYKSKTKKLSREWLKAKGSPHIATSS